MKFIKYVVINHFRLLATQGSNMMGRLLLLLDCGILRPEAVEHLLRFDFFIRLVCRTCGVREALELLPSHYPIPGSLYLLSLVTRIQRVPAALMKRIRILGPALVFF